MDGGFLDLNGEAMETDVEEFSREIFKTLKFFQTKQKKELQEKRKHTGKPVCFIILKASPTIWEVWP